MTKICRGRPGLLAAAAALLFFSGCLGSGPTAQPTATPSLIEGAPDAWRAETPSSLVDASVANPWGNATEVVLMREAVEMTQFIEVRTVPQPTWCYCYEGSFRLPAGRVVPPGTDSLRILVGAPSGTSIGESAELAYETAARDGVRKATSTDRYTIVVVVASKDADVPLSPSSGWKFDLHGSGTDEPLAAATLVLVDVQVIAHRGQTLPSFGPVPDPWKGKDESSLVAGRSLKLNTVGQTTWFCPACAEATWQPDAGALVPLGTKRIRATLSWDWAGASAAFLEYESTRLEARPEPTAQTPTSRTYEIAVDENETESPFQERSYWGFHAYLETRDGVVSEIPPTRTLFDVGLASGSVKLEAVAFAD